MTEIMIFVYVFTKIIYNFIKIVILKRFSEIACILPICGKSLHSNICGRYEEIEMCNDDDATGP